MLIEELWEDFFFLYLKKTFWDEDFSFSSLKSSPERRGGDANRTTVHLNLTRVSYEGNHSNGHHTLPPKARKLEKTLIPWGEHSAVLRFTPNLETVLRVIPAQRAVGGLNLVKRAFLGFSGFYWPGQIDLCPLLTPSCHLTQQSSQTALLTFWRQVWNLNI